MPLFFFIYIYIVVGFSEAFLLWRCSGIMIIWLGLSSNNWSSTSYCVVLNLMPDKIASFPFTLLQGEEPSESEGPKPVVFLLFNEQWIRQRLHVETRCFLPNAIVDALGKSGRLLCLPVCWPMKQHCVCCEAFMWSCPVFPPCLLRKPVPEKCHCCDGVKNKVWMLHSKLVPCFYIMKKKKRVAWRIGLTLIYLISL